jgi:hypothetical protein
MRLRRGPRLASVAFTLIVALAVGALAWGATHQSPGDGIGSAKDQAAARATLTALKLPAGLARDPSFTACGNISDACLTGNSSSASTLSALTTIMHSAGGSLPDACAASITSTDPTAGPKFTCAVQGRLKGAEVLFVLGDAWQLPGNPAPRTAVLATVVAGTTPPAASLGDPKPGTTADIASLLPEHWASGPQACAGGSATPTSAATSSPASSAPAASAPAPSAPAASAPAASAPAASATPALVTPALVTTPPLPACAATAITDVVSAHVALADAALALSNLALSKGFRMDGRPCLAGSTSTTCEVRGEHISSGVQQLFVANLTDDGRGDTVGTLAVTRQTQQPKRK